MPVRSADEGSQSARYRTLPPGSQDSRRHARRAGAGVPPAPRKAEGIESAAPQSRKTPAEMGENFKVASRDRIIPRQRGDITPTPRVSYEVILAVAIVVACMCGAMAVGAAFTLQV